MISVQKEAGRQVTPMEDYRECKIIFPSITGGTAKKLRLSWPSAVELAQDIEKKLSAISGGFTSMDAVGVYNGETEHVVVAHIAVKDDNQRFELLTLAYWLKETLAQECIYVQWDNGVVQFVGHPEDTVAHDWAVG